MVSRPTFPRPSSGGYNDSSGLLGERMIYSCGVVCDRYIAC